MVINIKGLDKADVLLALFNASKPQGFGELIALIKAFDIDSARRLIQNHPSLCFDYVVGRPIKVDLSGDELDVWLYDRDNGEGCAAMALSPLIHDRDNQFIDLHRSGGSVIARLGHPGEGFKYGNIEGRIFTHTVGLVKSGLSEIIILGLSELVACEILSYAWEMLDDGHRFVAGTTTDDPANFPLAIVEVEDSYKVAYGLSSEVGVLQFVMPDPAGILPWEDGYDTSYGESQPVLGKYTPL